MKQGLYVALLIISITIDLALIKSERAIDKIKPDQTLNDLINGTITDKIIDEISILSKQSS